MATPCVILFVLDGLRRDAVTPSTTPFLQSRCEQGVSFEGLRSVFPSSTRVCAATVATGSHPGEHGITENEMLVEHRGQRDIVSCADASYLSRLPRHATGTILEKPTFGQRLAAEKKRFLSACSGSSGTTYLTNPAGMGACVNWETAWPEEVRAEIANSVGFPTHGSSTDAKNGFILDVATQAFEQTQAPDVCLLWFTEPDEAQHTYGIGSPSAVDQLRLLDQRIEAFHAWLLVRFPRRSFVFVAFSDHGCVTPLGEVDPISELIAAGLKSSTDSQDVLFVSNSFFLADDALVSPLSRFLANADWVDRVFVRDDVWRDELPVSRLSDARCNHPRAAQIMVSYSTCSDPSDYGVPGACRITGNRSSHGSMSDYEMNVPLFAWGTDIRTPARKHVSADLTDIAPAVLALLGIGADSPGRLPLRSLLRTD